MKLATKLFAAVLCFFIGSSLSAQNISNKGKDFWVAYGYHQYMGTPTDNSQNMTIYLSVEDLPAGKPYATVTIEADSSDPNPNLWWKRVYHINANTVISVNNTQAFSFSPASALGIGPIPKGSVDAANSGTPPTWDFRLFNSNGCPNPVNPLGFGLFSGRGLHIKSDVDIVAYAHIYGGVSSGATMLLPTTSWGYSYTTINSNQNNADLANNFFFIIAQEDSTVVKITPSQQPIQLSCATATPLVPYTITLNKGSIYQYVGLLNNTTQIGVQLTGSKIESIPNAAGKCKKIAVFAGSGRTGGENGGGCGNSSRDNDMQQCFPEHTWGTKYLSAPFAIGSGGINACGAAGSVYKIVAKDTGTYVTINGTGTPTLIPPFSYVTYSSNAPCKFEGNKPIAVAQFMTSGNCNTGDGDPEMIYLSPVDQAISKVGFYRNNKEAIDENFVSIIIPDSGMASLKINGQGLATNFGGNACVKVHPQDNRYKIVVKGWTAAAAQVLVSSDARFNTITYGIGGAESYGYSGGTYLNNLAAKTMIDNKNDTITKNGATDYSFTFDRAPLELKTSITYPPKRLDWLLSLMTKDTTLIDTNKITLQRVCDGVKFQDVVDTQRGYFYTPPFQYVGNDTFYIQGCNPSNNCITQMHVVTVGCPLSADVSTKYVTRTSGIPPYTGNAATDMAASCGNSPYRFTNVDAFGTQKVGTNRGGTITVIAASGSFTYVPPVPANTFNGRDTFYIRLCDNGGISPTTCLVKMYVITVGTQFSIDTVAVLNGTPAIPIKNPYIGDTILIRSATSFTDSIKGNASSEINPNSGVLPYKYTAFNNLKINDSVTAKGKISINPLTGAYTYKPTTATASYDTFYIQLCDNGTPQKCLFQMHIVSISNSFSANNTQKYLYTPVGTSLETASSEDFNVFGKKGNCIYQIVDNTGITTTTSNKGIPVTINTANGIVKYNSSASITTSDTFYVKVCDETLPTSNCSTKMYIVRMLNANAQTEFNVVGGKTPYSYSSVDGNGNATAVTNGGGSIVVAGTNYTYTPLAGFTGTDSFYIKLCDNNNPTSCAIQKHIVKVGLPFTASVTTINNSTIVNLPYRGYASVNSNVSGGTGSYVYSVVNGSGAASTTSNKGCTITIKANNGIFIYTPTTGLTGSDTFYIKVCDGSATPSCSTQMYIVNINAAFTGTTSVIRKNVNNASQLSDTASVKINPTGGATPYTYDVVNSQYKPNGGFSGRGGTVSFTNAAIGAFVFTPKANYIGPDTFYVRASDASTNPSVLVQMYVVSVFPSIIGNSTPFYHSIAGDKNFSGNLLIEMPNLPKTSITTFIPVKSNGSYLDSSTRGGLVSMIPLPIDTLHDPVTGDRYIYKALPTLNPACDYVFIKKDTINDRIDTVYIPIVVYSKPVNGLPTGCYGAGGLVGDTIKLPYVIYPNPKIYRKNLVALPSCPTDTMITFTGVDSSIKVNVGPKTLISPAIRWIWNISGTYKNNAVNYIDTAKITAHSFDTGSVVCMSLTTIFTYGATNQFDTCFTFTTSKVKFGVFPTRLCLGQPIKVLDSTYSRTGVDSVYWDFGDGKFSTYSKGFDTNYVYKDTGSFTIRHTVKIKGCNAVIDTVVQKVYVSAKRFPVIVSPLNCIDTSGKADFWYDSSGGGVPIKSYRWFFGDAPSGVLDSSHLNPTSHIYPKEDSFKVKLYVEDTSGCKGDTTTTVKIHILPNIYFKPFATGVCINGSLISLKDSVGCLNKQRVQGYGKFKGPGIVDTLGVFDPSKANVGVNTIWYIYTSGSGACIDSVSQQITVWQKPTVAYDYAPKTCLPKNGIASFTNQCSNAFSFIWDFDDAANTYYTNNPNIVDSVHTTHQFFNTGLHNVKLVATSADGCKDSLTKPITFSVTPAANYPALISICENDPKKFINTATITNGVSLASGNYYGNGVSLVGEFSPAVASYGNDSITYIATSTGGCADTAIQYILVKARPRIGFTYPAGCLPASGIVQFTDTSKVPDGQTIQSCFWNFGDPASGALNTSNSCTASHTYSYGTYTVYHTVTSSLGCFTDTPIIATFSISPSLYYHTIGASPVCENVTSVRVDSAGSNNLTVAPGKGIYRGLGIIDSVAGIFNPSLAGTGPHTIFYVFTATGGCKDSVSQTITVLPKPVNMFTVIPDTGCLNTSGTVKFDASAITVTGSSITSYDWLFENGTAIGSGISPSHNYNNEGTYKISLKATAANTCVLDTSLTRTFKKMPEIAPISLAYICTNGGVDTLRKPAILNGVSGNGVFNSYKNAITAIVNGNAVYDPSISGYGIDTIRYKFTSTGGCVDSVTFNATIKSRPTGTFTFKPTPGTCLDTIGTVEFDATFTAPGSSVSGYTWNFGDGSIPSNTSFDTIIHNYKNDGKYTILLRVDAANGCWYDTPYVATFNKTPHIAPISHSPVCENDAIFKIDTAVVLNGAVGTWSFISTKNGFVNTTTGDYDPSKAGWGIDTIYCKFVSNNGVCSATDTMYLTIKSKPTGSFTYFPVSNCLDTSGTVYFDATNVALADGSLVVNYDWFFENGLVPGSGMKPIHLYNDGTYKITLKATASNGCSDTIPSITKTFNKTPHIAPISHSPVCENDAVFKVDTAVVLNGAVGTWSFSSTKNGFVNTATGDYDPSKAGWGTDTIYCKFLSSNGVCSATDTMYLTIKSKPTGSFTYSPLNNCLNVSGTVSFDATSVASQDGTAIATYNWLFENGAISGTGIKPVHNYADGIYTINLKATGVNGCSNDIPSITDTFYRKPVLTNISNNPICENDLPITIAKATVTNSATIVDSFFHSSKGAFVDSITGLYNPTVAGFGIDTITYTVMSKGGCTTSTTMYLKVNAKPINLNKFTFSPPGCLDATGLVKFNTSAISVPGSSPKKYYWQFESPSAIDSSGGYPTHNYAEGTYSIVLKVLGNNGCSAVDSITQSFKRTPSLDPIIVKNVCANDAPFLLTAPNVNNGVAGPTGVFTSYRNAVTGNSAVGYTYTPVVGSYIIDTIYYKFISNNGCVTSAKKVININPVPQIKLKLAYDVCRDTVTILRDMATIKSGHIDSTWWYFYDSTYVNPLGGLITRSFDSAAVYPIYFTAKSDSGCISNDTAKITVRPQPKAMFDFSSVVCMPQGTVFFTNRSTIDSLGGTMGYSWNFGDPTGSTATNPNTVGTRDAKHTYGAAVNYPVRLTVGSKEYGCFNVYDDTVKVQRPFYLKPIAHFNVTKDTLCEGEFTTFFDTSSTAPGSSLFSWNWDYGDGSTPNTTVIPTATYAYSTASSQYTATLVVRNNQLCESEPATKTIVVYKTPKIDSIPVIYAVDGSIVQFRPKVSDSINTTFSWSAPAPYGVVGLNNPNVLRPYLSVTQYPPFGVSNPSQLYTLYAQGQYNCTDSAVQVVKILGKIVIPNAFSPNGDGKNDKWVITSLADYPGAVLDIYDRYGQKIQHLTGGNLVWDGTINGTPAPVSTYYYVIDPGNNMPLITGWVVLLR